MSLLRISGSWIHDCCKACRLVRGGCATVTEMKDNYVMILKIRDGHSTGLSTTPACAASLIESILDAIHLAHLCQSHALI